MNPSIQAVKFFELLANSHQDEVGDLLKEQPSEIKQAFLSNSSTYVRNQFSKVNYFADSCKIAGL